ncbi:hypothetical protein B7767_15885 [Streptomyces sp. 13-12-16]|uniref:DUF3618 domain-containing protein n=1 Tax=Streptomyces sp. 13-12-16 TaxID=1570823 RepID=UPI000A1FF017|nr:DUF3618 domain-containing protein [Streptomyces sp. 13-12-16]OSP42373.1 hypothetical protein B7767_15885 [Streptomyces sp. 13-12-16]
MRSRAPVFPERARHRGHHRAPAAADSRPPRVEPTATSPEALREEVERSRVKLGETVEALAAETAVKARTQEKAAKQAAAEGIVKQIQGVGH